MGEVISDMHIEPDTYNLRMMGDPVLKTPSRTFDNPSQVPDNLLPSMRAILERHRGLGLAAQQAGSGWRVALLRSSPTMQPTVAINLRIVARSEETFMHVAEGCLSVQCNGHIFRTSVRRHKWVTVEYLDQTWAPQRITLDGLLAIVAQHECDHLDGRCIVDGLPRQQRRQAERMVRGHGK